jgi:hypothetical protein
VSENISIGGLMLGALGCYLMVRSLLHRRRSAQATGSNGGGADAGWGGSDLSGSADNCGVGDSGGCDGGGGGGGGD